ncbi:hypothetical protein VB773_14420 [Haloarculaceae archaeon H-GB2-1]|nr:hypothetical protein [Haloarculaceae archaeon H-GB2-1]
MQRATRRQLLGTGIVSAVALGATLALSPTVVVGHLDALSTRPLTFLSVLLLVYLARPFLMWPISLLSMVVGYGLGLRWGYPSRSRALS